METRETGNDLIILTTNTTICYDDHGEGSDTVIFIHGFPFNKSMWQPQMDFFKRTHRVIAYDVSCFGKSTDDKQSHTIDGFANDLIKLMDALTISKAIICGLSMGGYIALNAIKRFQGRFSALILADTQCGADTPEGKAARYATIDNINSGGIEVFSEAFIKKVFCQQTFETMPEVVERIKRTVLSNPIKSIATGLKALAERSETCSSLSHIAIPTLILCGKQDELTPVEKSEFMRDHIKDSVLEVIDHAGHLSNLEQPVEFNTRVDNLLRKLSS